jgi:hypothetical protein
VVIVLGVAYLINRFSILVYKVSSSLLIKENITQQGMSDENDILDSSFLGKNQNFQNEL